jgi:hypothetical protein
MGDRRRGHAPAEGETGRLTRFVILALGLLGFVVLPGAGPSPAGAGIGVRTGAAQPPPTHQAPGRGRSTTVSGVPDRTPPSKAETRPVASAAPPYATPQMAEPAVAVNGAELTAPRRPHTVTPDAREAVPARPRALPSRGRAPPAHTGS